MRRRRLGLLRLQGRQNAGQAVGRFHGLAILRLPFGRRRRAFSLQRGRMGARLIAFDLEDRRRMRPPKHRTQRTAPQVAGDLEAPREGVELVMNIGAVVA